MRGGHLGVDVLHHDVERPVSRERGVGGGEFVEDAAEGIDVGGGGDRGCCGLLRRHVPRRAEGLSRDGDLRAIGEGGQPEVEDFHKLIVAALACDHDVVGLQVAVDDVHGVRFGQGIENLPGDMDDELSGDFGARDAGKFDAVDVLHDDVGDFTINAGVDEFDDVWMVDARDGFGFAVEPREDLGIGEVKV